MKANRVYNFNPGPAALPLAVLEEIQQDFLDFSGSGMSIAEISHRSKPFDDVINDAVARTKRLLNLDDNFHVLFLQGFPGGKQLGRLCGHRYLVLESSQRSRDSGQSHKRRGIIGG